MDHTAEDLKSMGFFGIFKQSFKTIFSRKKLFTQITLSSILPLTLILLANLSISNHVFYQIDNDSLAYTYDINGRTILVVDWIYYWLFKFAYFFLLTIFSLASTAAVVFSIASIYTDVDINFMHVIKFVTKIWKKLLVTFVFIYLALFIYNMIYVVTIVIVGSLSQSWVFRLVFIVTILVLYILGFLYSTVVWQLASVSTVLDKVYGFNAIKKGKNLLNGKKSVGMTIAFVLYGFLLGSVIFYGLFVEDGDEVFDLAMFWRVMIGISCSIFIMILFLLVIVIQTVLYLVCKSYHGEPIDQSSLSTFLGEEIQLGRTQVEEV